MTNNKMDWKTIATIMWYLNQSKPVFKKWKVRFTTDDWVMRISYQHIEEPIKISQTISWSRIEILHQMQDFCLDCFFNFEWNWEELNTSVISKILWTTETNSRQILFNIYKKLKLHEKQFLH